jgi:phosphoglycolate phosphatase
VESNNRRDGEANTQSFQPIGLLIFDLDGTLIDSKQDLILSVNATRAHMGLPPLDDATVASYVGNGAPVLIRRALGAEASEEDVARALDYFVDYYKDHCLDTTRMYQGCQEVLDAARAKGIQMAILTNKPVKISNVILEGLGVRDYFFQVYGGNSFAEKKPHPVGIEALRRESGRGAEETVMVGDSSVDIETARNANVRSVGLLYGLQPESLRRVPPDLLLERMEELLPHL